MNFGPKRKPNLKKDILRSDSVHSTDPSCYLDGLFNFDSRSVIVIAEQFIALRHWEYLMTVCNTFNIVPPTSFTLTDVKGSRTKRK